jgi:glycosyltransferase involved in cell wall biosynthesis
VLVLSPSNPALTGNGLAMRVHMLVEAVARDHDVRLVTVGLPGRIRVPPVLPPGRVTLHELAADAPDPRAVAADLLSDPAWRNRLAALVPMPDPRTFAAPTLADDVLALLEGDDVRAVIALRLSTGLLGVALAERLGVPLIVDADDDDVALLLQQQQAEQAAQWERVGSVCFGSATLVTVAGEPDRAGLVRRYGMVTPVSVVPNAVSLPSPAQRWAPTAGGRILFLANLLYPPNIQAATWLVGEVLPLLDPSWSIDLVGRCSPEVEALGGSRVTVHGWIDHVGPVYRRADLAAVPVLVGAGTRIKVLEAMAFGCPVVSTTAGCAGIDAVPGRDLLVGDRPEAFARHVEALADHDLAQRLGQAGRDLVERLYAAPSVSDAAAALISSVIDAAVPAGAVPDRSGQEEW